METGWSLPYAKKKNCNVLPILRHLNPFQNILTAQYVKKYIAIFYLKKQHDHMFQPKKTIIGPTLKNLLK
jgi:hypothetical protein